MNLEHRIVDTPPLDGASVTGPRSGAQEFRCPICGLRTHDLTRPCPHWWGLLWRWFR
jgi:hypothetical protein